MYFQQVEYLTNGETGIGREHNGHSVGLFGFSEKEKNRSQQNNTDTLRSKHKFVSVLLK